MGRSTMAELVAARRSHDVALARLRSKRGTADATRCQRRMFDGIPIEDQIAEVEANRNAIQAEIERRCAMRRSKSDR